MENERPFDGQTVKKLEKRIRISYQRKTGGLEGADDCAQEILCRMLEGRHQHATIDQSVVDYLRSHRVDKRIRSYSKKQRFQFADSFEQGEYDRTIESSDGRDLDDRSDLIRFSKCIRNEQHRRIYLLSCQWGLNYNEIANIFGVTESRISQIMTNIVSDLRRVNQASYLLLLPSLSSDARLYLKGLLNGDAY